MLLDLNLAVVSNFTKWLLTISIFVFQMFILHMQTCQFCSILAGMAEIFCLREGEREVN